MPNEGNMRNRRVSSRLLAMSCASGDDVLSHPGRVDEEPRPFAPNDGLYVVGEAVPRTAFRSRPPENGAGEDVFHARENSNTIIDVDIRIAKWAWAVLVIGHCWLIYFMVQSLG
ncbi:hypothetical protein [Rhizobium sp. GR12]|uniref:hypothetical protein n=1 Tax=Rhizobium TaxID=379 RepID=UPI002FBDC908